MTETTTTRGARIDALILTVALVVVGGMTLAALTPALFPVRGALRLSATLLGAGVLTYTAVRISRGRWATT